MISVPSGDGIAAAATRDALSDALWTPSPARVDVSRLHAFLIELREQGVVPPDVRDAHALQRWSVAHPEAFWAAIWRAAGIRADGPGAAHAPWEEVLVGRDRMAPPDPVLGPKWFTGTRLNYAEHLLRRRDDATAIVSWTERGRESHLSYRELSEAVARAAAAMRAAGVREGDRVAAFIPNVPEAVIGMLAAASLGAIWSSCSPDFGTRGVLDRFAQIRPTLLIAADRYRYAGQIIDVMPRVREIAAALPTLRAVWIVESELGRDERRETPSGGDALSKVGPRADRWSDVMAQHADVRVPRFVRLPFDHPLYILYSSGTTGLPKCIVHGAGGTLLQHWKEHVLHTDIGADSMLFYFTTCGWMMWNWLVSGLATGAAILLYDGAPLADKGRLLWRMAERERVTVFGISAKFLAMSEKLDVRPARDVDLDALSTILSTGSPLADHSYDYVYRDVKHDVALCSISGGTDIVSCFALGDPTGPIHRGELQLRGLGMDVEVWSDDREPVAGVPGELVCRAPFPSMPVALWNDPAGAAYRAAYFEHFPGVWRHGDWAELTPHDGLKIHGRSDATLNPGGVRIGTAEIYRQVDQTPEVMESVVVEQTVAAGDARDTRDTRIVLFVRMQPGTPLTDAVRDEIRRRIRDHASPHHVPKIIAEVRDIPRTRSGKITELAVREAIHGRPVKNTEALANPEALEEFRTHPLLAG